MAYSVDNLIVYDVETYPNYFLVGFELPNGTVYQYQFTDTDISQFQALCEFVNWVEVSEYELAGFNSNGYDDPVTSEFIASPSVDSSYQTSVSIIEQGVKTWMFARDIASIDLMQTMPKRMGLKMMGICLRHKELRELPFDPHTNLKPEEMPIIAEYNRNDLAITRKLATILKDELQLRHDLSVDYGVDLRSKGRAASAEAVLCSVMERRTGMKKGTLKNIARENVERNPVFKVHRATWFDSLPVDKYPSLKVVMDKAETIYDRNIHVHQYKLEKGALSGSLFIGDRWYTMGIGGLHSLDGAGAWVPGEDETLMDVDVTSYYPAIMLTQHLSPRHWIINGIDHFEETFGGIVTQRIAAKKAGDSSAGKLKIVINSAFGKLNDEFSALYDPYNMASVTVTGQIALLALVAMVDDVGGTVVSANTDGITILYKTATDETIRSVISEWEALTEFDMEYCEYKGFYQKDVNNYIAVPTAGSLKLKGVFNIPEMGEIDMEHTPNAQIVTRAVRNFIETGADINLTITNCRDLQEFLLTQQASKAFSVAWRGEDVGNMVRFYKAIGGADIIKTPKPGNETGKTGLLSNSASSVPLPDLPNSFDSIVDVDYDWYIKAAGELLATVTRPKRQYMNTIAKLFESNHMTPALITKGLITKGKASRKSPKSGETDFSSMLDSETFGVATGRSYGVIAKRLENGATRFYKVDRKYPSKTRKKIMKDEGFELIFGSNVDAAPYSMLYSIDQDYLDTFFTPSELRKAREEKVVF